MSIEEKDLQIDGPIHVQASVAETATEATEDGQFSLGNLYEMNKALVKKEKALSMSKIREGIKRIRTYCYDKREKENEEYFMMLCHEKRDYTIFKISNFDIFEKDLEECLVNRGQVKSINVDKAAAAYEIWMQFGDEPVCYYFFPYTNGIVFSE